MTVLVGPSAVVGKGLWHGARCCSLSPRHATRRLHSVERVGAMTFMGLIAVMFCVQPFVYPADAALLHAARSTIDCRTIEEMRIAVDFGFIPRVFLTSIDRFSK